MLTSSISLLISNTLIYFLAVYEKWDVRMLILIYLLQAVIIGVFQFIKILDLKQFSTQNFLVNGHAVEPTVSTKRSTAFFFLLHYGIFMTVFLFVTLFKNNKIITMNYSELIIPIIIFAINHAISFARYRPITHAQTPNIGTVMFMPYVRIFPMAIMITITNNGFLGITTFFMLKTIADLTGHIAEHLTQIKK